MINVKPTTNHIKTIKEHKRFLEKWDMWDFAYFDGKDYYFVVVYTRRGGKITGYLILNKDGYAPPLEQVKSPAYHLISYNTMVHNTITILVPRTKSNVSPVQLMSRLITTYKNEILKDHSYLTESIEKILQRNSEVEKYPEVIKEIAYTLGNYQLHITRKTGFFDKEFLNKMEDEFYKYDELVYKYGIREREIIEDYEKLLHALQMDNIDINRKDKNQLIKLLRSRISSIEKNLKKSLESYEKDEYGKEKFIDPNNIKDSIVKNIKKSGRRDFQNIIMPKIRNK